MTVPNVGVPKITPGQLTSEPKTDEAAEPNPFENIQPSDFNDPRLSDAPADPPSDDVPGQNTQK